MKFVFKILFIFCLTASAVFAREVKFIQITDIDLDKNNAYKLQKTIKEINSYRGIDFVVFSGNNIAKPTFENLEIFLYLLKKVNKKSYVLLGSSDVLSTSGVDKNYYLKRVKRALFFTHSKKPNYIFKKKGYVFVVMDGSKQYFQSSNGYYTKEEIAWLDGILTKYKNKPVIILQHFPVLENSSKWLETARLDEYWEVLKKHKNVKVIVCGHYGYNFETKKEGIYHIITESYSKNGAYKIIEIDLADDFIGTHLVK